MADHYNNSNERYPRDESAPQSIPLQDLNRPPDADHAESPHRRTLSDRGRSLLRTRDSRNARYAPLSESSPPPDAAEPSPLHLSTQGLNNSGHGPASSPISPVGDVGAFQNAIGFAGLSFEGDSSRREQPSVVSPGNPRSPPVWLHPSDGTTYDSRIPEDDNASYFKAADRASAATTSTRHLAPSSPGAEPMTPVDQTGRSSFQSVQFLTPERASASPGNARLGDDLGQAEAGLRLSTATLGRSGSGGRPRSLSPSALESPLRRAGTMMRNISQRVVNISNEPELIERAIRRKSSQKKQEEQQQDENEWPSADGYGNDGPPLSPRSPRSPISPGSPLEKLPSPTHRPHFNWKFQANPLRGKSLGLFPANSPLRMKLCDVLTHPATEPILLLCIVMQTVLLTIDSARSVFTHPRSTHWGTTWIDYFLLGLFVIYTIEIIIRVIVSGFIINPVEYSTINRQIGVRQAMIEKGKKLFAGPQRQPSVKRSDTTMPPEQPALFRSFTTYQMDVDDPANARQQQRVRLAHRAFLRHSFNRLDFVAVVSFWISFIIGVFGVEEHHHTYVFRMLSCLRILRLLGLTSGTTVILRSLKRAAPLLVNVGFLISFFWLLFAIIGVQSFKSSLRRTCVWIDPAGIQENYTTEQYCGGYLEENGTAMPWIASNNLPGSDYDKGYLCPWPAKCIEGENQQNGTVSYDNIFQSLELVFVIMTSNTFSDIMYNLSDSDYLAACLYFAFGIVIMALWLINLLIAVITSSFQVIRDESKTSAFMAQEVAQGPDEKQEEVEPKRRKPPMLQVYLKTRGFWVLLIVFDLIAQALRSHEMSEHREHFIDRTELVVTAFLLLEIIWRFIADWRNFHRRRRNLLDLFLAIITTIMQLPPVRTKERVYAWMTVFQIMRFYRVVLAVSLTRELIMTVLGNVYGLLNLILFVFLLTFLAALFAAQIFRGEIPEDDDGEAIRVTFYTLFNSFLGMYQLLSSENWTDVLFTVQKFEVTYNTAWIGAAFLIIWYILSNFIVLNMFIAVIQENFDVSEDEKRLQQVKAFLHQKELGGSTAGNLALSTIFKVTAGRKRDPLDYGAAATEMLLKDAVVRDFLDEPEQPLLAGTDSNGHNGHAAGVNVPKVGVMTRLWDHFVRRVWHREPNPFYSRLEFSKAYEDLDPRTMAHEVVSATERRKKAQREYLRKHPSYNVSLFMFKPHNPIRRICQRIVGPGRGDDRIEGVAPSIPVWYAFSAFIYAAIVAMVLLACITTPVYQKEYFESHGYSVYNWFVYTDLGFAILFTVEALIKVIADGFFWTPNAYFRSSWGFIDGVVLITLWINIATLLLNEGDVSRAVGAFKALRALRLLNVSDSARNTFHHVIVRGGWKVMSAAFVSLSFLIPFAIYGLNLFNGRLYLCNDGDSNIVDLNDCVGEYLNTPFNWEVLSPRQAANPYYDFDNFGNSLFILFQIVSQEGWIDVMYSASAITGVFRQPEDFVSQGNAVYFVVFNLLGAVFVLTLFVSVFMRNYTEQTGVAYLTTDQRSWLELRKLLRQISPSKRPSSMKKRETWEEWCYRRAVKKTGRWQRFITFILILHLLLLCLEYYPEPWQWGRTRDYVFLLLTLVYIANIAVRIVGLGWTRFRRSSWDIYSLFAVSGTFATTILLLTNFDERVYVQLHKLFLVSITLLLIPRNNQLDQLFKTAAASVGSIANLLATWFVMFLVFAIAFTQAFGLTRFGPEESGNINFRTVPKALILLFRMSSGEGWNEVMEDFASIQPPLCTVGEEFYDGDCGSAEWARTLFILWNVLSMYIFVNLFVSLIYESFSYVYQRSSGLSVISREEIRRYKQAWAEFDPHGTGFISKEKFPRLLGELSGVFEMRIYDGDFTVSRIIEDCSKPMPDNGLPLEGRKYTPEIDLRKLNERLDALPCEEIRRRRARMNRFFEEMLNGADPDRGIHFTSLLITLAHYKVINDNKSLRLEEFLRRKARLQRVEESVQRKIVIGFFDTLFWARRFRRVLEAKRAGRMTAVPQFEFTVVGDDAGGGSPAAGGGASSTLHPDSANMPGSPSLSPYQPADTDFFDPLQQPQQLPYGQPAAAAAAAAASGARQPPLPPLDTEGAFRRSRANSIQKTPIQSRANSIQASPIMSPVLRGQGGSGQGGSALHSIPLSPTLSPHMSGTGGGQHHHHPAPLDPAELNWQLASALNLSRPASPVVGQGGGFSRESAMPGSAHSSVIAGPSGTSGASGGGGGVSRSSTLPGGVGAGGYSSNRASGEGQQQQQPARSRQNSDVSAQDVLEVLDNSIWGESIRKSFTVRRPGR